MTTVQIVKKLQSLGSPENVAGMARFGIVTNALGVPAPQLKQLAKDIKKNAKDRHGLALELWDTGIHDARAIACLIDDPKKVTALQMDNWADDFDNWATCDSTCGHLFSRTEFGYEKAFEWSESEKEFVKRAGIIMMAWLAVHDKKADDEKMSRFLPVLEKHANDERNFIKKAVNWSLRQIGKRNLNLNKLAVEAAERIKLQHTKSARWIAADALRELKSEKTLERLNEKNEKQITRDKPK